MKKKLGKTRILYTETPEYLEEYNRQNNKELIEIHFAFDEIFHRDYGENVDAETQGFLIAHQLRSMDHYKILFDMSRVKCENWRPKAEVLSEKLKGKYFDASLVMFPVKELLKKCEINGDYVRFVEADKTCNYLYKVYIGKDIEESIGFRDMAISLKLQIENKYIYAIKQEEIYAIPEMLSTEDFYLLDIDFDEYHKYLQELEPTDNNGSVWTNEELEWGFAAAFEFCPQNQYGIIE